MASGTLKKALTDSWQKYDSNYGPIYIVTYGELVFVIGDLRFTNQIPSGTELIDTNIPAYERTFAAICGGTKVGDVNIESNKSKVYISVSLPADYYRFTLIYLRKR